MNETEKGTKKIITDSQRRRGLETMLKFIELNPELLKDEPLDKALAALIEGAEKIGIYEVHGLNQP